MSSYMIKSVILYVQLHEGEISFVMVHVLYRQ
jgi:hypothetical protein